MKQYAILGGLLVLMFLLPGATAFAGPLLQRTTDLQPVTPVKRAATKVQPTQVKLRPKPQIQLAAVPRRMFVPMAELKVATEPVSSPSNPAGSGEFPTKFLDETSIPTESLSRPHLYLPFRWRPKMAGVKAVEWQVCRNPSTVDLQDWQYPPGLLARGRSSAVPPASDREAYLVIDFRPIYDLPPGYSYPRPLPSHRPSAQPKPTLRPKPAAG